MDMCCAAIDCDAVVSSEDGERVAAIAYDYIRYDSVHLRSLKKEHDVKITYTAFVRASPENHAVIGAQIP
ncbi:hypothetical protein Y1Q_0010346 [Alligator mississippiensis]|uniref:Uncharacterized protein n=1 Tax=Alligator mississippiensis TaxID=8496 RepID=A0A151NML7_ALLMI|nr:hypothetical protein Y1Q_0010346 [Alligator mississippiensis]